MVRLLARLGLIYQSIRDTLRESYRYRRKGDVGAQPDSSAE